MADRLQREPIFSADSVAGSVRRMHSSQTSAISNFSSGAAERVLSVDAVMDVARAILWPESSNEKPVEIDGGEVARAQSIHCSLCC